MEEQQQPLLLTQETSFLAASPLSKGYGAIEPDTDTDTRSTADTEDSALTSESGFTVRTPSLDIVGLSYVVNDQRGHWWNGSCFRPVRKKIVLHNLCMSFKKGELTALVGSSGSGKTSLLDVISGRATGEATGVVSYKHEQCTRRMMQQKASYVLQADRLLPTLTVREMLTFMANLKLPGHYTPAQREEKVEGVILDMGLIHVANTRIGGAVTRGVSGGEKRRITIGIHLLKDPEILLLDEPTSGLDAFTARNLVTSMAELAHKGKLVIMSIHQPRSDIFKLLDKLAMLTIGQAAFFGSPRDLVPYFTRIGFPCPKNENPIDIYVDVVSVDRRTPSRERSTLHRVKKVCNAFSNSDMQSDIVRNISSGLNYHFTDIPEPEPASGPSWIRIFHTLLVRLNIHLYRDRSAWLGRMLFLPLFVPFIVLFLGHLKDNQGSIQDRLGLVYQATQTSPFMGLTNAVALFPILRDLMYRECHDGMYSTGTFLLAYYFHVLPYNIITVCCFSPALYWIAGMNDEFYLFGVFTFVLIVLIQFGEITGVTMMALFKNPQVAYNSTCFLLSASGLLSTGILRSIDNMPKILQWIGFVPIHKYTTEIIVANEFHDKEFECSDSNGMTGPTILQWTSFLLNHEYATEIIVVNKFLDEKFKCVDSNGTQCIKTGEQLLDLYYPDAAGHMDRNFGLLGGYTVGVVLCSWLMFKIRGVPTLH